VVGALSPSAGSLPVVRFWGNAIDTSRGPLAATLGSLAPSLTWTQNPNYRREPPDPSFLDSYGYAVLVGPSDGAPPLVIDPGLALGVLLLGPGTHYPLHHHPAVEVYVVVSGDAEWWRDAGPWRPQDHGALIHHTPNMPHAMRTGKEPLLAVYLWRGDLATYARLGAG
jgi:mannose-6-phosphate isomerase-like protein (cupin superfamily)